MNTLTTINIILVLIAVVLVIREIRHNRKVNNEIGVNLRASISTCEFNKLINKKESK